MNGCALSGSAAEEPLGEHAVQQICDIPPPIPPPVDIGALKFTPVPEPANLYEFVMDKDAAIALGKALFWDMQAGSDGVVACASCHFQAGVDSRKRNQLSPGLKNALGGAVSVHFDPTGSGGAGGPNYELKASDFPFHRLANPQDRDSAVLFDTDDVAASQGVFKTGFQSVVSGSAAESCALQTDIFQVQGVNVRRVEPRNTPTVINAVFNYENFWDGRANNHFNGVDPFGRRSQGAVLHEVVYAPGGDTVVPVQIDLDSSSLASQAVGPPGSPFEMSCDGRTLQHIGRKLLPLRPLANQKVHAADSVLAGLRHSSGKGLTGSYAAMVQSAFWPWFWDSTEAVAGFTLMESNFSLFWGLAIQLYEATLVSDDSRFDRFMSGSTTALSAQEKLGMDVFTGKGLCVNCHNGAEFTSAATELRRAAEEGELVERMLLGGCVTALYDSGFYNTGIRPTVEDLGRGEADPFGNPLSFTRQAKIFAAGGTVFDTFFIDPAALAVTPGTPVTAAERDGVDGSFKVPTLRNIGLTSPYFHNGGYSSLAQVVDFYNRGGDRRGPDGQDTTGYGPNGDNHHPDITPLGLTAAEKGALVAFLLTLTDDRVRYEQAPFDHPQLFVADGALGTTAIVTGLGGKALDKLLVIPPVGAAGRSAEGLPPLQNVF